MAVVVGRVKDKTKVDDNSLMLHSPDTLTELKNYSPSKLHYFVFIIVHYSPISPIMFIIAIR